MQLVYSQSVSGFKPLSSDWIYEHNVQHQENKVYINKCKAEA